MVNLNTIDNYYKIMVLGDSQVGKTSLLTVYHEKKDMIDPRPTIGSEIKEKYFNINGCAQVDFIDTTGQKQYRDLAKEHYRSADGFILVFDLTSIDSLFELNYWLKQIQCSNVEAGDYPLVLFGNKKDLKSQREVHRKDVKKFRKIYSIKKKCYFKVTSTVNERQGIVNGIDHLLAQIVQKEENETRMLEHRNRRKKKCCCCC